ncbi:MAG: hypothetical protein EBZ47_04935 [Chlamydiae bacterium]|nr:hypothetical protein [Chlamydiota bacterium]
MLNSLTALNVSRNQLTSLPESIETLTSLTYLDVSSNRLTSLPASIERLSSLIYLHAYDNQLPSLPASIERLTSLTELYVSNNQLTSLPASIGMLTSLTELYVSGNQLTSLPASIGTLTSLTQLKVSYNQLTSLPESIIHLPASCRVDLENSGLSNQVVSIRETCQQNNYAGPQFHFSIQDHNPMQAPQDLNASLGYLFTKAEKEGFVDIETRYPQIHSYLLNNPAKANTLQIWLSRLSYMQTNPRTGETGLASKILSYLELAEQNEVFRENFFSTIEGASITCGDRMALSVLHLGIQHRMEVIDKSDLKGLAEFLIHGPWMLERLEEVARAKVQTLRFVDEIEVYLGFPVKLRERLHLQIDVEDMLYFACSGITDTDLKNAASYIEAQISTPEARADILIQRDTWMQALQRKYPVAMQAFKRSREEKLSALEEDNPVLYSQIQAEYHQNIRALTLKALR